MDKSVVDGVRQASVGSLNLFLKTPELAGLLEEGKRPASDWDFYMTVAGVGLASLHFKKGDPVREEIIRYATGFDDRVPRMINDFLGFVLDEQKRAAVPISVKTGLWVIWSMKGSIPSDAELNALAPQIGEFLTKAISDFK